jgi:hypothetical protein
MDGFAKSVKPTLKFLDNKSKNPCVFFPSFSPPTNQPQTHNPTYFFLLLQSKAMPPAKQTGNQSQANCPNANKTKPNNQAPAQVS